jgi:hypothetical protein
MSASQAASKFPSAIPFPEELRSLFLWKENHGYPISGEFELREHDDKSVVLWFGSDRAVGRLGIFGAGPDGSMYALWLQDNGDSRVVHLGSEGRNLFVLARDMREFLLLLAVGYLEIGFEDLSQPPDAEGINPKFRKWVASQLSCVVPATGGEIVRQAQCTSENFETWVHRYTA